MITAESIVDVIERPEPVDDTPWELVVERLAAATGALALETGWFRSSSALIDLETLAAPLTVLTRDVFTPGRPVVDAVRAPATRSTRRSSSTHTSAMCRRRWSRCSTSGVVSARTSPTSRSAVSALVGLERRVHQRLHRDDPAAGEERSSVPTLARPVLGLTPAAGWIAFDPTNDHLPANDHVTVAQCDMPTSCLSVA
ncbi:MAG: hypothetical protein R2697_13190 [Ilumatobacteraceae bacterium]